MSDVTRYKCTRCSHILEIKNKPSIYGGLIKIGGYAAAAVIVLHFFAIILMVCLFLMMDSIFDSNEVSSNDGNARKCKKCGCENFETMDGGY